MRIHLILIVTLVASVSSGATLVPTLESLANPTMGANAEAVENLQVRFGRATVEAEGAKDKGKAKVQLREWETDVKECSEFSSIYGTEIPPKNW